MKKNTILDRIKNVVLAMLLLLGIDSLLGSVVGNGLEPAWMQTCVIYPNQGFLCENAIWITSSTVVAVAFAVLGILMLVRWLKVATIMQVLLASLTYFALTIGYMVLTYDYYYPSDPFAFDQESNTLFDILNWSSTFLVVVVSSLWLFLGKGQTKKKL